VFTYVITIDHESCMPVGGRETVGSKSDLGIARRPFGTWCEAYSFAKETRAHCPNCTITMFSLQNGISVGAIRVPTKGE